MNALLRPISRGKSALLRSSEGLRMLDAQRMQPGEILIAAAFGEGFLWAQARADNFAQARRRQRRAALTASALAAVLLAIVALDASVLACAAGLCASVYALLCWLNLGFVRQQIRALESLRTQLL